MTRFAISVLMAMACFSMPVSAAETMTDAQRIELLEKQLAEATGLRIDVADKGKRGGKVTIAYKSLEQLDDICKRLGGAS